MRANIKKTTLMAVVVALFLFSAIAAGCKKDNVPITEPKFHTGTEGLYFEFPDNAPPDSVYENNEFSVIMAMHNRGAYDIKKGVASLSFENDYLTLENDNNVKIELKGKSLAAPEGERKRVVFKVKAKKIGKMSEKHEVMIIGNACYDYATDTTETVCIDPDIYDADVADKACEMKEVNVGGRGSPITIKSIDVKMASADDENIRPEFIIRIENDGKGIALNPAKIEDFCSDKKVTSKDMNVVYLTKLKFMGFEYNYNPGKDNKGNDFECFPNPVKLNENDDTTADYEITCILKEGLMEKEPAFSTELYVRLEYGYSFSKSTKMEIRKILK